MSVDLHTHSTASDGTDTPAELIAVAHAAGIDVLAITDHDTAAGWTAAATALPRGMILVPGIEISCYAPQSGGARIPLHLLGYLLDPADAALGAALAEVRASRIGRARLMVDRMRADGLPITWDQVHALAGAGTVGRPHLARALVHSGVVGTVDEGFAGPLSSRSPYYVPKADIEVFDAIGLVRAAGGVCVFAHPRRRGRTVDDGQIAAMAGAGLAGLEVDHPDHDPAARAHLARLALDLGLLATGSSDYHGTNKTTPIAARTTAPEVYAALVAQAARPVITGI